MTSLTRNEHQPAIDAFHELFRARYGTAPTWTAKRVAQVKGLVRAHGLDETIRRIEILFTDAPAWMTEPYTVPLLVGAFDALAVGAGVISRTRDGLDGDDLRRMAEALDDEPE